MNLSSHYRGFISIPVMIGIFTVIVFAGIVIAAFKQEQRNPPSTNQDIEANLETVGVEEQIPQETATSTQE